MEVDKEIRKRCECAINLDLFRTNTDIVRDIIEENLMEKLQRL